MPKGCPGATKFKEPVPDEITCPHCGGSIEIWSDESLAQCHNCHNWVPQIRGASCIDWCPMARECIGTEKYERLRQDSPEPVSTGGHSNSFR